jgi:hypothetical protein
MNALATAVYSIAGLDHEEAEAMLQSWLSNARFALAYGLLCEGFSVIPLLEGGKKPARKWKKYQTEYATILDLVEWFIDNNYEPAIVTGEISNITVIDCDNADAIDNCIESGIESMMRQRTKRGIHFVFRHNGERNTVRVNGIEGVDRRGEGGYVKAYPDSGSWTVESVLMCEVL